MPCGVARGAPPRLAPRRPAARAPVHPTVLASRSPAARERARALPPSHVAHTRKSSLSCTATAAAPPPPRAPGMHAALTVGIVLKVVTLTPRCLGGRPRRPFHTASVSKSVIRPPGAKYYDFPPRLVVLRLLLRADGYEKRQDETKKFRDWKSFALFG